MGQKTGKVRKGAAIVVVTVRCGGSVLRHASFRPQTQVDVQKIVRERERPAIRKYLLFYRPDRLHFSAFFVTGDNFVFQDESFGAVSAILNSDKNGMALLCGLQPSF
jgi:hypothetical protein